ncbi:MAG: HSP20 family molecular chaperone IbpA [Flavobacteriaceae bacterium]|jgi:HSP20 family molecular chaperone IbpA
MSRKKSFFEKLTGAINHETFDKEDIKTSQDTGEVAHYQAPSNEIEEEDSSAELTVDLYDTGNELVLETMIAGVPPEQLDIQITRDMVQINGERKSRNIIQGEGYYTQELFWGSFTRQVLLPEEIDPELVDAEEKHGLLVIRMPKKDKNKKHRVKVKAK